MPDLLPFNRNTTQLVPGWLYEHLKAQWVRTGEFQPDAEWAESLLRVATGPNSLSVLEPLDTTAPSYCQPYCCYSHTVVFYYDFPRLIKHSDHDYPWRTFPCTHFARHGGRLFEVCGASIVHIFDRWNVEWRCRSNTVLAGHFDGRCEERCQACWVLYGSNEAQASTSRRA